MMAPRYPGAIWDSLGDAGPMLQAPARGTLHTTEGSSYAGARKSYVDNKSNPHFTVSVETGEFRVWQHCEIDWAARAMKNAPGGVDTNRLNCIQLEIVWRAEKAHEMTDTLLDGLADLMAWCERERGIKPWAPPFHGAGEGIVLAVVKSPIRMRPATWVSFDGWCGHQHVPENDHWDPGRIPIERLLQRSAMASVPPMPTPPAVTVDWTEEALMALPTLSRGAKGQHVKILQGLLLVAAGDLLDEGDLDGDFGPKTETVLRTWQDRTGRLSADGVCGPATWRWLMGA